MSVTTVLEAYHLLEDRGWIEARPQSGYYVRPASLRRPRAGEAPPEPTIRRFPLRRAPVQCADLVLLITRAAERPDVVPLGTAVPSSAFLPVEHLNRLLARAVRWHAA